MNILDSIEKEHMKKDITPFNIGDTIKVSLKVREGDKERIQVFEGVCMAFSGGGARETFTVRKVSYGVGVERIIPLHSPLITKIQVIKSGRVRRAKLFYLRELRGKAARIKEKEYRPEKAKKAAEAAVAEKPAKAPKVKAAPKPKAEKTPKPKAAAKPKAAPKAAKK